MLHKEKKNVEITYCLTLDENVIFHVANKIFHGKAEICHDNGQQKELR